MKKHIRQTNESGFSLIELIIVVLIIGIIAVIAVPNLLKARVAANEASAVHSISLLFRAENSYRFANNDSGFTDIATLYGKDYIDQTLGNAPHVKSGYRFETQLITATAALGERINITANPVIHTQTDHIIGTGSKHFGVTEAGGIYSTSNNSQVTFDDETRSVIGDASPIDNLR